MRPTRPSDALRYVALRCAASRLGKSSKSSSSPCPVPGPTSLCGDGTRIMTMSQAMLQKGCCNVARRPIAAGKMCALVAVVVVVVAAAPCALAIAVAVVVAVAVAIAEILLHI